MRHGQPRRAWKRNGHYGRPEVMTWCKVTMKQILLLGAALTVAGCVYDPYVGGYAAPGPVYAAPYAAPYTPAVVVASPVVVAPRYGYGYGYGYGGGGAYRGAYRGAGYRGGAWNGDGGWHR